jgi:hypothetical protein
VAKKSRTPDPPKRPVQAPKRRDTPRGPAAAPTPEQRRRIWLIAAIAGGTGLVGVIIAVIVLVVGGGGGGGKGSTSGLAKTMKAVGCTYNEYPSEGRAHVTSLDAKIKYKTFPPTSGKHYQTPALWGNYPDPVVEIQAVHNLEHGGLVIQYGPKVPKATVDKLNQFYNEDANALLMAPWSKLGNRIALSTWRHASLCTRFDEKAFRAFRDKLRYHGPEAFPPSVLKPGM